MIFAGVSLYRIELERGTVPFPFWQKPILLAQAAVPLQEDQL